MTNKLYIFFDSKVKIILEDKENKIMLKTMEQAQELIEQAYQRGFNAGYDEGKGQVWSEEVKKYEIEPGKKKEYIEKGRNEAWEVMKKLVSMGYRECNKVLGDGVLPVIPVEAIGEIFARYNASEVIEKIRAYEEQKMSKDFKVGDIIKTNRYKAVITWCDGNHWNGVCLQGDNDSEVGMTYYSMDYDNWTKTVKLFRE